MFSTPFRLSVRRVPKGRSPLRSFSFARASGRYFGKIIFVGFIMVAFTAKKQALHDMIAGCLVVRNT
jgi:uncharacterized RDD family membrane protein YckC